MKSFRLGPWRVHPQINTLVNGDEVRIEPQVMEVLCRLAHGPGDVVSKDQLIQDVWQGRFVGDEVITNAIWELRRALGDNARRPTFIQTIPKRGYRLIAPVSPLTEDASENASRAQAAPGSPADPQAALRQTGDAPTGTPPTQGRAPGGGLAWLGRRPLPLTAAACGLLLAALLLLYPGILRPSGAESPQPLRLAVLPFQELGGDEYFARGLSDALAGELARFPHFRVVAGTSSQSAAEGQASLQDIARTLDARALIRGTVQRQGSQVRLTLQMADSAGGAFFWSQPFQQEDSRLPLLILRAAQEAAEELSVHYADVAPPEPVLKQEIEAMGQLPPVAREAFEDYQRGVHFWKSRTEEGLHLAVQFFQKAIEGAPHFASAYAGLANAHLILADHCYAPARPSLEKAHGAALEALRLDPENAQALTAMAWILWVRDWNWAGAEELFRQALRHNPSYSTGHQWLAALLEAAGRSREAEFHSAESQRLDVLSPIVHTTAATVAWTSGRPRAARQAFHRALQLEPDFIEARKGLFYDAMEQGDVGNAVRHCLAVQQHVLENDDWRPHLFRFNLVDFCRPQRIIGRDLEEEEFKFLEAGLKSRQEEGRFISPFAWLELYVAAGRTQEASRWLKSAIGDGSRHLFYLPQHPEGKGYPELMNDPRLASQLDLIPMPEPRD